MSNERLLASIANTSYEAEALIWLLFAHLMLAPQYINSAQLGALCTCAVRGVVCSYASVCLWMSVCVNMYL